MSFIPPSGVHDSTCKFICRRPADPASGYKYACTDDCEHRCTVCAAVKRCSFCHAPPGEPCRTILYEEHVEHGNGKEHEQPHAARTKQ